MAMTSVTVRKIDRLFDDAIDQFFDRVNSLTDGCEAPSEVEALLDKNFGMGDQWREWWTAGISGDEEWH